jgi:deazaflavin-dependent oxidoreductase (nitroreductase family)
MPLPHSIARFNKRYTNRVTRPFAARLPGFGVVIHEGRRSGRVYETPVNVFRRPGGFAFALTYGRADWVKNVMEAGGARVVTRGRARELANPTIVEDPDHAGLPRPVRLVLRLIEVDEMLLADERPPR